MAVSRKQVLLLQALVLCQVVKACFSPLPEPCPQGQGTWAPLYLFLLIKGPWSGKTPWQGHPLCMQPEPAPGGSPGWGRRERSCPGWLEPCRTACGQCSVLSWWGCHGLSWGWVPPPHDPHPAQIHAQHRFCPTPYSWCQAWGFFLWGIVMTLQ